MQAYNSYFSNGDSLWGGIKSMARFRCGWLNYVPVLKVVDEGDVRCVSRRNGDGGRGGGV